MTRAPASDRLFRNSGRAVLGGRRGTIASGIAEYWNDSHFGNFSRHESGGSQLNGFQSLLIHPESRLQVSLTGFRAR